MSGYAVEPDDLRRVAAVASSAAGQAQAAIERVRADGHRLFDTGWHGPAASTFRLGWEQWVDGAVAMLGALDDLTLLLKASAGAYVTTEQAVRVSLVKGSG